MANDANPEPLVVAVVGDRRYPPDSVTDTPESLAPASAVMLTVTRVAGRSNNPASTVPGPEVVIVLAGTS